MLDLTIQPQLTDSSIFPGLKELAIRFVVITATVFFLVNLKHLGLIV